MRYTWDDALAEVEAENTTNAANGQPQTPLSNGIGEYPLTPEEIDIIGQSASPSYETPSSFGLTRINKPKLGFFESFGASALGLPSTAGGLIQMAGEQIEVAEGAGEFSFESSFKRRLLNDIADSQKNDKPIGGIGSLASVAFGVARDAVFSGAASIAPAKEIQEAGKKLKEKNQIFLEKHGLLGDRTFAGDVGGTALDVVASIGMTLVTKNPAYASTYMALRTAEPTYAEARRQGLSAEKAFEPAFLNAAAAGAIESIGQHATLEMFKSPTLTRVILQGAGISALEEGAQGAAEEAILNQYAVRDKSLGEAAKDVAYQMLLGAVVGAPINTIYAAPSLLAKKHGIEEKDAIEIIDNLNENRDKLNKAAAAIIEREVIGLASDPAQEEMAVKILRGEAPLQQDSADLSGVDELELALSPEQIKAQRDIERQRAEAIANATMPIEQQQQRERVRRIEIMRNEIDEFKISLTRDIQALLDQKTEIDQDTFNLLEAMRDNINRRRKMPKPLSLTEYLEMRGGLKEYSGELTNIGVPKRHKLRRNKTGMQLDDAGLAAFEAGYFDSRPTVAEFTLALEADFKGDRVWSSSDLSTVDALNDLDTNIEQLDKALGERGIGADFRLKLQQMRNAVARNKKADRDMRTRIKKAQAEAISLRRAQKMAEENTPVIMANKLKTYMAGLRKGGVIQRAETKAVQKQIIEMLENSNLPAGVVFRHVNKIKNTQTVEQLERVAPQLQAALDEQAKAQERKAIIGKIQKVAAFAKNSNIISVDLANKILAIVDAIDTKKMTRQTAESLNATLEFIKNNPEHEMPDRVIRKLSRLSQRPVADITTEELKEILSGLEAFKQQGIAKKNVIDRLRKAYVEKTLNAIKAQGSDPISSGEVGSAISAITQKDKIEILADKMGRWKQKAGNFTQKSNLYKNPMDVIFDILDGAKNYTGAIYTAFKVRVDDSYSKFLDLRDNSTEAVKKLHSELGLNDVSYNRIGVYAVAKQDGGRIKLYDAGYNDAAIDSIVLSPDEQKMYEAMREALDSMLPSIKKVMRLVYNKDVVGVKDYFPFLTDFEKADLLLIQDRIGDTVPVLRATDVKQKGFTEERTGGKTAVRIDAFGIFLKHMNNAAYLIEMGQTIKEVSAVASHPDFAKSVGDVGKAVVAEWINLLSRNGQTSARVIGLDNLRRNTGIAMLGAKLSTILVQPSALALGGAFIGANNLTNGIYAITQQDWRNFILKNMPEVRDRIGDDQAYQDAFNESGLISDVRRGAIYPLRKLDAMVASAVAAGAYIKYINDNNLALDLSSPDANAIKYAQFVVRRTQASPFAKDAPPLFGEDGLTKNASVNRLIFQFQTFTMNLWSNIEHDMWRLGVRQGEYARAAHILAWILVAQAYEMGARDISNEIINALTGFEPDDDDEKGLEEKLARASLNAVPFVGQIANGAAYGSVPIPVIGALSDMFTEISYAIKSEDDEKQIKHAAKATVSAAGIFLGVPALQINQIIDKSAQE